MLLYDKPVRLLMRDMIADLRILPGNVFDKAVVISWFAKQYPKVKEGTISAHLVLLSTNNAGRLHHNPKSTGEDDLFFKLDAGHFRLYEAKNDPSPLYKAPRTPSDTNSDNEEANEWESPTVDRVGASEFAYERDLRNFLAKHLSLIEDGLRLYEEDGITGIEFPVGGRFVDLLAVDSSNSLVVLELKVSRGYDRVVGQLLRYMAWIEKHQADLGQKVRGVIIAKKISEDLILACSKVPNVSLYEYELSVTLKRAA